jgi:7-cyano-7-deazaguanine synthase in queuosine biosynthesis
MDSEIITLEAYRGTLFLDRCIEIIEGDTALPQLVPMADRRICASSFSGGKDSLLQAALLNELVDDLMLVTTTSPMAPFEDHITTRRRYVLNEVRKRLGVRLIEITSNYRELWNNGFASRRGYPLSVSEMSDTFLYFASLLISAVALGATHLFLASEAEVQVNAASEGGVVQATHFMYSTITQQALQALLGPLGISYCSLTSPLHNSQVQRLLWRRYTAVCDLQYSCWLVKADEAACSACSQCLRMAMGALEAGGDPERIGIDLSKVFRATRDWKPKRLGPGQTLPDDRIRVDLSRQMVYNVRSVSTWRLLTTLLQRGIRNFFTQDTWHALAGYTHLRLRVASYPPTNRPGYRAGFLRLLDELCRERAAEIFAANFDEEPTSAYDPILERNAEVVEYIREPLLRKSQR